MVVTVRDRSGDYVVRYDRVVTVVETEDLFIVCCNDGTTATFHWTDPSNGRRWIWEQVLPFND